jgi:hypothetical protein
MKKILTLIGVAALLATASFTAYSQEGGYSLAPVAISLPPVILLANSPSNFPSPFLIDFKKSKTITPTFTVSSADAASTTNVTFLGAWSTDGTFANADTNNSVTLTANMLAGKPCCTATNILTGNGRRYFFIWQESIGANSKITNNAASYDSTSSPW